MSNGMYAKGLEKILTGQIDFINDTICIVLLESGYVVDLANHEFYSDVNAYAAPSIAAGIPINNPSSTFVTGGLFTTGPAFGAGLPIPAGPTLSYVVLFMRTGDPATSPLIAFWDTGSGFPFTPNG